MLGIGRRGPLGRAEAEAGGGPAGARDAAAGATREMPAAESQVASGDPAGPERDAWVVLAGVEGVGPVSFARLVGAFGSARAVLDAAVHRDAAAARWSPPRPVPMAGRRR